MWHVGLTAYEYPQKADTHEFIRVKAFRGSRGKREIHAYSSLAITEAERVGPNTREGGYVGLWVGITFDDAHKFRTKAGGTKSAAIKSSNLRAKSVNEVINSDPVLIKPTSTTRKVVIDGTSSKAQLFALANPDRHGLSDAIQIDGEEVWWASRYRDDDERRIEKRRGSWPAKAREAMKEHFIQVIAARSKPMTQKRGSDGWPKEIEIQTSRRQPEQVIQATNKTP
ncbi:hypothetical protein B0J11DRAFT_589899 [Dendryphion nanum]|uniref:Uncharacterized protein n=1 Tax=Dendryphion nanum TaxID=256645 RepID=A0A9P9DL71_9PLEO|nr:hypothetical protein B0J11DRAFT_589899 [Dendryphion nanum]